MTCSGLYTALITPFKNDRLDEEGLRSMMQRQRSAKVAGVVALGTTAETPTLSQREKERILQIVREEKGSLQLIVNCGCNSTWETLEKVETIEADFLLIAPPAYNKPEQEGLYRHFSMLAERTKTPIILYNHPGRTGVNLTPEIVARLAQFPTIVGIKECSGNIIQAMEYIESGLAILSGDDALILPLILVGGKGAIASSGNLIPFELEELVAFALAGDLTRSLEIQRRFLPLFKAGGLESNPIPLKAALQYLQLPSGEPRLPLTPLSKVNKQKLIEVLEQCLEKSALVS
ncbi:MAG: 4-hydroxy-tetrahydrodipicolinate synthase [Chlamydiales bacterium]